MISEELQQQFQNTIGYTFHDSSYLIQALTHRSYLNESETSEYGQNERLEFLGDAVLELVVTEHLYQQYSDKPEGELTSYRAALVKGEHLAKIGFSISLEDYIQMSRGERQEESSKSYVTANAMEAVIAAIYLDGGLEQAQLFVHRFIVPSLKNIIEKKLFIDAKSYLQELVQEQYSQTPEYRVMNDWGPDHDKLFEVGVYLGEKELARGKGRSKQKAQQQAASIALDSLQS